MRIPSLVLTFAVLGAPCFSQRAIVYVDADAGPRDLRPFGKYLVEVCTLSGAPRVAQCAGTAFPGVINTTSPSTIVAPQTVKLKLACDPSQKGDCNPQYPLIAGSDFFVAATADSGQPVLQTVTYGSATPLSGSGTVQYRANNPGTIIVRGTAAAVGPFAEAAPVDLVLQVIADPKKADPPCLVLPPASPAQNTPLDAPTIVTLIGNPTPFVFAAQGPNTIAIYSTRQPLRPDESGILDSFQRAISILAGRTVASLGITLAPAKPFSVELAIPHAAALGDLAARVSGLNYSQFTVLDVGRDKIRVTAPTQPECDVWKGFLTDIRRAEWQLIAEPMSTKLYYLSSSDVATAFTSLVPAPAAAATPAATPAPAAPAAAATGTAPTAAITVSQPAGSNIQINSDTTPCVVAGLVFGNPGGCGTAASTAPAATTAATAATPPAVVPLAMASVAVAAGNGEQTPPDLLVYSDTNPGDDAQILERNRILAQLDLPRPEMIINAWVIQNSSASQGAIGSFGNMVKDLVRQYDDEFENVVFRGWESVKNQSASPSYFNEPFRSYIEDRFVADTFQESKPGKTVQELSQAFLDNSQAKLADPPAPQRRTGLGICERGHYCLGYNELFKPVKPALTDLLLTIIAAQLPRSVADNAIALVEGHSPAVPLPAAETEAVCEGQGPEVRSRCRAIWTNLDLDHVSPLPGPRTCADRDFRGILYSLLVADDHQPRVHLQCFKEQADLLFSPDVTPPSGAGLLRAAIADFLFNYKMSQQYPHEFAPYDLSHSADVLNNAMSPLIDAFNRDITSYQLFVRADMQYRVERLNVRNDERCCVKRLFGLDKPSFFNDGLVTVRTISGQSTYVNTTTQSSINASTAPQLTTLLSSLTTPTAAAPGAIAPASAALSANPLARSAALANILSNYQSTFAQIGRSIAISAIPRSLNTASSAEIAVTLNVDESAAPTYNGGGATTDPAINTSRVASHDTATRVRIDSIKLFEISSLSAIVERSRSRFPLLPPFVEIPYIGTFAGIPMGPAKEFHSSTAVLSAYVVPTAADIAYGLRFVPDLVVDGLNQGTCSFYKGSAGPDVTDVCLFRKALSLRDLDKQPIGTFNKQMIRCLATNLSNTGCQSVNFESVPKMY